jgi:hypothetical protein
MDVRRKAIYIVKFSEQFLICHTVESARHPFQPNQERQLSEYCANYQPNWDDNCATDYAEFLPAELAENGSTSNDRKESY